MVFVGIVIAFCIGSIITTVGINSLLSKNGIIIIGKELYAINKSRIRSIPVYRKSKKIVQFKNTGDNT